MKSLEQAAQQALEALGSDNPDIQLRAAVTLRAALAEPQPEPVAWAYCPECGSFDVRHEEGNHKQCATCFQEWFSDIDYSDVVQQNLNRLYITPPQRQPLTQKEAFELMDLAPRGLFYGTDMGAAQAIWLTAKDFTERAHGIGGDK